MQSKTIAAANTGGAAFIMLAAVLWGTTGTSQALAPAGVTPLAIGAMRLLVGGGALWVLAWGGGLLRWDGRWRTWGTLVSGASVAVYQLTFFAGVALTGVAVGTIIAIGSAPIFSGMLDRLFLGATLSRRWYVATALAVAGSALLVLTPDAAAQVDFSGVLLALGAGLSYSVFALMNKRLIDSGLPSDAVMAVAFSLGAALLLPALLFVDTAWMATTGGLVVILHLGLLATGLAYALYGRGLRTTSISMAGTLSLIEPLTATVLGVLVVGERLTTQGIVGIAVLLVGLVILIARR